MNTAEQIEMLELEIEYLYRQHYTAFGKWVKVPESPQLAELWASVEALYAEVAT